MRTRAGLIPHRLHSRYAPLAERCSMPQSDADTRRMTPTAAAARCHRTVANRGDRELSVGTRPAVATNPREAKMHGATMNARGLNNPDAN